MKVRHGTKNLVDTEPRVQPLYKVISRKGYGSKDQLARGFVFPAGRKEKYGKHVRAKSKNTN